MNQGSVKCYHGTAHAGPHPLRRAAHAWIADSELREIIEAGVEALPYIRQIENLAQWLMYIASHVQFEHQDNIVTVRAVADIYFCCELPVRARAIPIESIGYSGSVFLVSHIFSCGGAAHRCLIGRVSVAQNNNHPIVVPKPMIPKT
jgi:hypothetical protein